MSTTTLPPSSEVLAAAAAVFLLDQLAAREQLALAAAAGSAWYQDEPMPHWSRNFTAIMVDGVEPAPAPHPGVTARKRASDLLGEFDGFAYPAIEHIVANDSAAVLADVAAQRATVEALRRSLTDYIDDGEPVLAAAVLLMLVQAHAGRPGFREEWRP